MNIVEADRMIAKMEIQLDTLSEALRELTDAAQSEGFEWMGHQEVIDKARAALKQLED